MLPLCIGIFQELFLLDGRFSARLSSASLMTLFCVKVYFSIGSADDKSELMTEMDDILSHLTDGNENEKNILK